MSIESIEKYKYFELFKNLWIQLLFEFQVKT
jgi:hypothetical protein